MKEKLGKFATGWVDPEDAPEWTDAMFDRAELAAGMEILRPATGTLTKLRGRPPLESPKKQITLRLSREVIEHFRATGAGWQTRIDEALKKAIAR